MRRYVFLLVIAILVAVNMAYAAECESRTLPEGFKCIEGSRGVTVYNPAQLNEIFGSYVESNGALALKQERNIFAYLNGTIVTENADEKQARVSNGGLYPAERALFNATIYGTEFSISAKQYPALNLGLVSAVYEQRGYTVMCARGENCMLKAAISPARASANLSGAGVIVQNSEINSYVDGKKISPRFLTEIKGMSGVEIFGTANLSLVAVATPSSQFDTIGIRASEEVKLNKTQKEGHLLYSIEADTADILTNEKNVIITPKNPQNNGLNLWKNGEKVLEIKGGAILITSTPWIYEQCAGREIYEVIGRRQASKMHCALFDRQDSRIAFQPKFVKRGDDVLPFGIKLSLPTTEQYNKLEITGFNSNVPDARIIVAKAGVPGEMNFEASNITISESNWFDFGISFLSLIYVPETQSYLEYSCDLATRRCYYDNIEVMGPPLEQRQVRCDNGESCGEGRECISDEYGEKFCVRARQCEPVEGLPNETIQNPINVLFVSDFYGSEEEFDADIAKAIDAGRTQEGLLGIAPFSNYADRFRFYKIYTGRYTRPQSNIIFSQCPEAHIKVSFSAQNFVSYADFGTILFSTPQIDSASKSRVFVHEFAHAFGDVKDEYMQGGEEDDSGLMDLDAGDPNCVDYNRAKEIWKKLLGDENGIMLADQAKTEGWYGCGGYCDRICRRTYLRPSANSIMGDHRASDGGTFNPPTEKWLDIILTRWASGGPVMLGDILTLL